MDYRGKRVLITGAGSGLGAAMSRRFGCAGYAVGLADIEVERAEQVLQEIVAQGGSGFAVSCDVTQAESWNELKARIGSQWGGLDILINNAGVAAAGRLEDTPLEDWRWVIDTDLMSVVLGCHAFLPLLREQESGHIVNVASFAGMTPVPEVSAYAVAKAAVVALSEQLRVDLAGSGVNVSVVCPTYVQTRLLETFRSPDPGHRKMAGRWMEKSDVSADDVADEVFVAVERRRFLVLTHRETRWLWRFRRWAPERYFHTMVSAARRMRARSTS
jgi:NADP-dependent 3-hydroxy acid dehydrogenase YdfG